jgi:cytochrome c oxidase assembly factor CtaG
MALAQGGGYHGPPELTVARAFTEWTLDPWMLALVVVLGGCYLAGARHLRRRGVSWPLTRTVNFLGLGLGVLVIATMSSLRTYYGVLFYMRSFQTILLLLLVPLFLALGRPVTLAIQVFPTAGRRIERGIRSRLARTLTFPAITTLLLVAVPFVMYFTNWYTAAFHSAPVRELTYLALMAPGYVFFWTLLRVDPVPKAYSYGVSLWITAVEVIGDAFLGLAVIADTGLIGAAYYHALARPWGPTLQTDQILGGGTLWIFGDLVGLPFLVAQLIQFIREDEAEAAEIDAELDARDAARARAKAVAAGVAGAAGLAAGSSAVAGAAAGSSAVAGAAAGGPGGAGAAAGGSGGSGPAGAAARGSSGSGPAAGGSGAAPVHGPEPAPGDGSGEDAADHADPGQLWWQNDPRFSDRFKQV